MRRVCAVYMTYTLRADRHVCLLIYRSSGSVSTGTTTRLREKKKNDFFIYFYAFRGRVCFSLALSYTSIETADFVVIVYRRRTMGRPFPTDGIKGIPNVYSQKENKTRRHSRPNLEEISHVENTCDGISLGQHVFRRTRLPIEIDLRE